MKCELDASIRNLYCIHKIHSILNNYQLTPHGTHIAFVSKKKKFWWKHNFSVVFIRRFTQQSQCYISKKDDASNQTITTWPIDTSSSYVRNNVDEIRIWIGRYCCCRHMFVCTAVWWPIWISKHLVGHSVVYSNALKPIIEPLINLNLLRFCYLDILIYVECACTLYVMHQTCVCVFVQFEFTIFDLYVL